jgi:hypothetical protein
VGESHYQNVLRQLLQRSLSSGRIAPLVVECEPTNKFDANAVRITTTDGLTIGYLRREVAAEYCKVIAEIEAAGYRITCFGKLVGGDNERPSVGVWIDLIGADDIRDLKP